MNFSQWLQEEMQKNNLTEYRIAKLSGVHQTTIKNLLSGTKPQIGTEEKIKRAIERINAEKQKNPAPKKETGWMTCWSVCVVGQNAVCCSMRLTVPRRRM